MEDRFEWQRILDALPELVKKGIVMGPLTEYTYTFTFVAPADRTREVRFEKWVTGDVEAAWDLNEGDVSIGLRTKQVYDPNARIDYTRLQQYHAVMKDRGFASHDARYAFRKALGIPSKVASALTNGELDKILAAV